MPSRDRKQQLDTPMPLFGFAVVLFAVIFLLHRILLLSVVESLTIAPRYSYCYSGSRSGLVFDATVPVPWETTHRESSSSLGAAAASASASSSSSISRRGLLEETIATTASTLLVVTTVSTVSTPLPSVAYTPDPDKLQESLYFVSRVQEATIQQERFIRKLGGTQQLRQKLKLTLRLIDKNYKLLDQINYSSAYVTPGDKLVEASAAGYEAVDALQGAIEFVDKDQNWDMGDNHDVYTDERTAVLVAAMVSCREQLSVYTEFMPADKLTNARYRVEDENIKNRDEFDGDDDAGVYNPVNLPWKPVLAATAAVQRRK